MQISVTAKGTEFTPALKEYAEKKVAKLEEFFHNMQKIEVVLQAKSNADAEKRQVAEIRVWLAGLKMVQAQEGARDLYAAIDLAVDEAKRQIERHKEKMTKEKRREGSRLKQQAFERSITSTEPEPGL